MKRTVLSALTGTAVFCCTDMWCADPILKIEGNLSNVKGWSYVAPTGGEVYIPFEGMYEDKGGKQVSPKIALDKKRGENAFYQISFTAKTNARCFWWIDFFDFDGKRMPDWNSAVYPGAERSYVEVFMASAEVKDIHVIFSSQEGVTVKNIEVKRITDAEAAAWCDNLMKEIPDFKLILNAANNDRLPRTKDAIVNNKPFRILLLGDSIVNDTWTSNFIVLFRRAFPGTQTEFILSVRGETGCWYYSEPANFKEYVTKYKPDLVLIGGISHKRNGQTEEDAVKCMQSVVEQSRAIGAEVVLLTPSPSREWRKSADDTAWPLADALRKSIRLDPAIQKQVSETTQTPLWDLTTGPAKYISESGRDLNYFRRDAVHNNDRGKQLIARTLVAYFEKLASEK